MIETIGNVHLDLSKWNKKDEYSDGDIEFELLNRLKSGEEPLQILASDHRYPVIYHFSPERKNIIDWYPFDQNMDILEVGAGLGALTGLLCEKCGQVTALDLSATRSRINAYRNKNYKNLNIIISNLSDFKPERKYDVITLIGVLEYAELFFKGDRPFSDMLIHLKKLLKEDGAILIAIENQFGVKYFSGAREDHDWSLYTGVEGYLSKNTAKTFGRKSLENLLKDTGFAQNKFYYPYPDYKMPRAIFSDDGPDFFTNISEDFLNFGEYVYKGANQAKVLKAGARDGIFQLLSNSFFVEAKIKESKEQEIILYIKHSTKRSSKYAIRTEIWQINGERKVRKYAVNKNESIAHLELFKKSQEELCAKFNQFHYPGFTIIDGGMEIEYIKGDSYFGELVKAGEKNDFNDFINVFDKYKKVTNAFAAPDLKIEEYELKDFDLIKDYKGRFVYPSLIDLTLDNILTSEEKIYLIDQEWVFDIPMPQDYLIWRSVHFAYETLENIIPFKMDIVLEHFGITKDHIALFERIEAIFRSKIFDQYSMLEITQKYLSDTPDIRNLLMKDSTVFTSVLFIDDGEGFRGDKAEIAAFGVGSNNIVLEFNLEKYNHISRLRFDPVEGIWCDIVLRKITYYTPNGEREGYTEALKSNAWVQNGNQYLFESTDSQILLEDIPADCSKIRIQADFNILTDEYKETRIYYYHDIVQENKLLKGNLNSLNDQLRKKIDDYNSLIDLHKNLNELYKNLNESYKNLNESYKNEMEKNAYLNALNQSLQEQYEAILHSVSYRVTSPLRTIRSKFNKNNNRQT